MATRIRPDAGLVPDWDDDPKSTNALLWYAKGIGAMQQRGIDDPTSLRYQAAVHEYRRTRDPLKSESDKLPKKSEQDRFWSRCQHSSWYFLPWHRWYLWYYERIVGAAVAALGGPKDWALPYWNYSKDNRADARRIPRAFLEKTLPDGSPNPLRIETRQSGNDGSPVGDETDVDIACLQETQYTGDAADLGLGGPVTGFLHGGGEAGALERGPHGFMHVAVGGWMGFFNTTGLDPLFYCHHANIDRLWAVWRKRDPNNVDPTESAWLDMTFDFHDEQKKVVTRKVRDVVDTTKLGYEYEDTSDPLAQPKGVAAELAVTLERRLPMAERPQAEMIGASDTTVALTTQPTETIVSLAAPSGPAAVAGAMSAPDTRSRRVFVRLENITGEGHPRRYSVYLNGVFAGAVPLFGVEEASAPSESHSGSGLHYRLDVTNVVEQLQAEGKWDPANVKVAFSPDMPPAPAGVAAELAPSDEEQPHFEVGRVSVYLA